MDLLFFNIRAVNIGSIFSSITEGEKGSRAVQHQDTIHRNQYPCPKQPTEILSMASFEAKSKDSKEPKINDEAG